MKKYQHGFGVVEAILIIVILLVVGALIWIFIRSVDKTSSNSHSSSLTHATKSTNDSTPAADYAGWKSIDSEDNSFSLKYPNDWTAVVRADPPCTVECGPPDSGALLKRLYFGPTAISGNLVDFAVATTDNSDLSPYLWFKEQSGADSVPICMYDESNASINGYTAYHVKHLEPELHSSCSTKLPTPDDGNSNIDAYGVDYIFSHKGHIIDIATYIDNIHNSSSTFPYLEKFEQIARSIHFN